MRWYIVTGKDEHQCEFVSVNVLRKHLWLRRDGITFKVIYEEKKDYDYAKRGNLTRGLAQKGKNIKAIKFTFK